MTHTHYALIDEEKNVIAVILSGNLKSGSIKAIEDDTCEEVVLFSVEYIRNGRYQLNVPLQSGKRTFKLIPTWEY